MVHFCALKNSVFSALNFNVKWLIKHTMRWITLKFTTFVYYGVMIIMGQLSCFCGKNRVIIISDKLSFGIIGCSLRRANLDQFVNLPVKVFQKLRLVNLIHIKFY